MMMQGPGSKDLEANLIEDESIVCGDGKLQGQTVSNKDLVRRKSPQPFVQHTTFSQN